jgi:hypothetical protein
LTGGTSGVTAKVVNAVATDGTDPDTLFVKYMKTASDGAQIPFTHGETITSSNTSTAVVASCHTGAATQIKEGVYYINGFHVQVSAQTLILEKYSATPSYRVGLTVTESFVTPGDDTSLNDNAQSVSNTNAPGAHRFKIELTLAAIGKKEDEEDQSQSSSLIGRMGDRSLEEGKKGVVVDPDEIMMHINQYQSGNIDGDDLAQAIEEILVAMMNKSVTFSDIREDEEPTAADLKKKDSVATISNKLQKLTAKMKKKAKEFKEAEGKAKDKLKDELKDMTAEKKKLEKDL